MLAWLKERWRRVLPKIDKTYRDPAFLDAWFLVHDDFHDFEPQLRKYAGSNPEVRRAARLLLEREIERSRPGKADAIRAVALATVVPIALVGVGIWSDWSAALFSEASHPSEEAPSSSGLTTLFAEAFAPTLWGFIWVVGGLLVVLYVWALSTWGADKKRGTHVAWLQAYRDHETSIEVSGTARSVELRPSLIGRILGRSLRA